MNAHRRLSLLSCACLVALVGVGRAAAQAPAPRDVVVAADAPIYLEASTTARQPLVLAKEGSVLHLIDLSTPNWYHVEFQDPQYGRRIGFIEQRYARLPGPEPVDVSVRPPATMTAAPSSAVFPGRNPTPEQFRPPPTFPGPTGPSRAGGFFIGFGVESTAMITDVSDTVTGTGGSLVLGYGFNPTWAFYTESSGADIGGATLAHFDIGARAHFLAPTYRAVPFIQFGLSGRAISDGVLTVSGAGVSFGGGVNVHMTPGFAFSGAIDWSVGTFSQYRLGTISGNDLNVRAVSARLHLGLIWFPQASHNQ